MDLVEKSDRNCFRKCIRTILSAASEGHAMPLDEVIKLFKTIVDLVDDITEKNLSWFSLAVLLVECFMHRRITKTLNMIGLVQLKGLEYFRQQKEDGFYCLLQMESWLVIQLAGLKTPDVYQQT